MTACFVGCDNRTRLPLPVRASRHPFRLRSVISSPHVMTTNNLTLGCRQGADSRGGAGGAGTRRYRYDHSRGHCRRSGGGRRIGTDEKVLVLFDVAQGAPANLAPHRTPRRKPWQMRGRCGPVEGGGQGVEGVGVEISIRRRHLHVLVVELADYLIVNDGHLRPLLRRGGVTEAGTCLRSGFLGEGLQVFFQRFRRDVFILRPA
jgi:hypothetical protein